MKGAGESAGSVRLSPSPRVGIRIRPRRTRDSHWLRSLIGIDEAERSFPIVDLLFHQSGTASPPNHLRSSQCSVRSEEHTSELQSRGHLVCRLLLEKKKTR